MQKAEIANALKSIERDLYKVNADLQHLNQMQQNIRQIYAAIVSIEDSVQSNKALHDYFKQQLKNSKIMDLVQNMDRQLSSLRTFLEDSRETGNRASSFIERFRSSRIYNFSTYSETIAFMQQLFESLAVSSLSFMPEFIGTVDVEKIALDLDLKKTRQGLLFSATDFKKVIKYLMQNRVSHNFRFHSDNLKIFWRSPKELRIESDSDSIKRLDRLCHVVESSTTA